jgi:hypothetical protein
MQKTGKVFVYRWNPSIRYLLIAIIIIHLVLIFIALTVDSHKAMFFLSATLLSTIFLLRSYRVTVNEHGVYVIRFLKSSMIRWGDVEEVVEHRTSAGNVDAFTVRDRKTALCFRERYLERFSFLLHQVQTFSK